MKKRFIEINRFCGECSMRDILSINRIDNIYIDQPECRDIVIVRDDGIRYREHYPYPLNCIQRFEQLLGYLNVYRSMVRMSLEDTDQDGECDAEQDT